MKVYRNKKAQREIMRTYDKLLTLWDVEKEETDIDNRIAEIGTMITSHTAVSKTVYVSADEAWEGFKTEYLGEYEDGFTENPLADSANYEIYLSDVSMQSALVTYLESIEDVRQVNKSEITANT